MEGYKKYMKGAGMEGYKAGWKVLSADYFGHKPGLHFSSCVVTNADDRLRRTYEIDKETFPAYLSAPLCVFDTEQNARAFMNTTFSTERMRYRLFGCHKKVLMPCWFKESNKDCIDLGWKVIRKEECSVGSIFADSVIIHGAPVYEINAPLAKDTSTFSVSARITTSDNSIFLTTTTHGM